MTNLEILTPTQNERVWAALSHLSILIPRLGFIDLSFIVPFIIWVSQKDKSQYIAFQSFQAFTYQLCRSAASLISYGCFIFSVFIFNAGALLPIGNATSVIGFAFIAYGIVGAIMAFQGKPFRYWIIGTQVEQIMPSIMEHKSWIYMLFIGTTLACVLILLGVYLLAAIGQANA